MFLLKSTFNIQYVIFAYCYPTYSVPVQELTPFHCIANMVKLYY